MPSMPDLMNPLRSLQGNLERGMPTKSCALNAQYKMIFEEINGVKRFSYAKVVDGEVHALAIFALAEPIDGLPCFNIGCAVETKYRGCGLGVEAVSTGIEELRNGFGRSGKGKSFYVEAVVEVSNRSSVRLAEKLFSASGKPITDAFSGVTALHFKKIVKF